MGWLSLVLERKVVGLVGPGATEWPSCWQASPLQFLGSTFKVESSCEGGTFRPKAKVLQPHDLCQGTDVWAELGIQAGPKLEEKLRKA